MLYGAYYGDFDCERRSTWHGGCLPWAAIGAYGLRRRVRVCERAVRAARDFCDCGLDERRDREMRSSLGDCSPSAFSLSVRPAYDLLRSSILLRSLSPTRTFRLARRRHQQTPSIRVSRTRGLSLRSPRSARGSRATPLVFVSTGAALVLPTCNTEAMQLHLNEIATRSRRRSAILILIKLDGTVPKTQSSRQHLALAATPRSRAQPQELGSYASDWLSPCLQSSTISSTCCYAWTRSSTSWKIMSIARRDWALAGHSCEVGI